MQLINGVASMILAYAGYFGYEGIIEELFPGSRIICERMNIIKKEDNGVLSFTLFGKLHRVDGPARIWSDGSFEWYYNGKLHRPCGPAVEYKVYGAKYWYWHGNLHRLDGPAAEYSSGYKLWYIDGNNTM